MQKMTRSLSGLVRKPGSSTSGTSPDALKLFMPFRHISYLKKASATQLRTNLGGRKEGHFYDQFLMSPNLADKLADGGELLKDCGMISLITTPPSVLGNVSQMLILHQGSYWFD